MARDEEEMIRGALESLRFADHVLLVDTGSKDRTVALARRHSDRIVRIPWKGFAHGRNAGIGALKTGWILMLDADERISPALASEIRGAIARDDAPDGFRIPIAEHFFARRIAFMSGDPKLRLFRRGKGRCNEKALHEGVEVAGQTGTLRNEFAHHGHRSIEQFLRKIERDAEIESEALFLAGHRATAYDLCFRPLQRFWKHLIVRGGWKDGVPGFIACAGFAFLQFVIGVRLWERWKFEPSGVSLAATLFSRQRKVRARIYGGGA